MTKEQKMEMFSMRLDGKTYAEIAEKFGVTRQCVQQAVGGRKIGSAPGPRLTSIFPNLLRWVRKSGMGVKGLAELLGINYKSTLSRLHGQIAFTKPEIDTILEASGMDYEIVFAERREDEDPIREELIAAGLALEDIEVAMKVIEEVRGGEKV